MIDFKEIISECWDKCPTTHNEYGLCDKCELKMGKKIQEETARAIFEKLDEDMYETLETSGEMGIMDYEYNKIKQKYLGDVV